MGRTELDWWVASPEFCNIHFAIAHVHPSDLVFRQENFDGSQTLKIQPPSTPWAFVTRQI
ncbi:MAG: hypothetical protein K6T90_19570 [Leptolyngbyaceae cyanobacterium HOT.MB2.61]|nr:hypothetical protein [Leptolyngbyaceae cyanobacterium HOT.MB2.61]